MTQRRHLADSWTRNCLTMGPSHQYTPAISNRDGYENTIPRDEAGIERMRRAAAISLASSQYRVNR